ncbi:MAG: hypothetical protein JWM79_1426 [Nocardioides sp.]|nr:hypothetical protein [Nocardioides sp.]
MSRTARLFQLLSLCGAVLWSVGLIIGGYTVPVYDVSGGHGRHHTVGHATLVGENGNGVLIALALPLAITVVVGTLLMLSRRPWALISAGSLTAVLAFVNLLAMLTIGIFIVPVTAALVIACVCALVSSTQPVGDTV